MKKILLGFILVSFCASPVSAEVAKTFLLKDGTTVQGRLVSFNGSVYVIESPALGRVEIKEANVVNMTVSPNVQLPSNMPKTKTDATTQATPGKWTAGTTDIPAQQRAQMQDAQKALLANPEAMAQIQALASDPEIIKLLSDPELMNAVASNNPQAISSNPRIKALLENPKMLQALENLEKSKTIPAIQQ